MTVDKVWKTNQAEFFAFDKFTLQILANKSGCVQTNVLFFFLYTTSEEIEYYEALFLSYRPLQNAVFHNFSRQITFIQYSGPSKHACTFSETVQKISKITYMASWF